MSRNNLSFLLFCSSLLFFTACGDGGSSASPEFAGIVQASDFGLSLNRGNSKWPITLGTDADGDGFTADASSGRFQYSRGQQQSDGDCDDTNPRIYPGIYRSCGSEGTQVCQKDGNFSACVEGPLCESSAGTCSYLSAGAGAGGDGSFAAPYRDFSQLSARGLRAGEYVYVMNGEYRDSLSINVPNVSIKAYPGHSPVMDPGCSASRKCNYNIQLFSGAAGFLIEGLELARTFSDVNVEGGGIRMDDARDGEIRNNKIRDHDGDFGTNTSGIYAKGSNGGNVFIHHNEFYDNFMRAQPGNQNNVAGATFFQGSDYRFNFNLVYYSSHPDVENYRSCVKYKHTAANRSSTFELGYNALLNCGGFGYAGGQSGSHIHDNIVDTLVAGFQGAGIHIRDLGGLFWPVDILIERNIIRNARCFEISTSSADTAPGPITIRNNICLNDKGEHSGERADIQIGIYDNDEEKRKLEAAPLRMEANCYLNPNGPIVVAYFASNSRSGAGEGAYFSLSGFQEIGFESSSIEGGFNIEPNYSVQTERCLGR